MNNTFAICILAVITFSCNGKIETSDTVASLPAAHDSAKAKRFEMYEFSEMASLLETMFATSRKLKENIIQGKDLGEFQNTVSNTFVCNDG